MNYQTFPPHPDLEAFISCYWTLEVPAEAAGQRQRIVPDGCIEMAFLLGDDIKRFTAEDAFVLQPRAMVVGQITQPYVIAPTGHVNSFAVRFYPYGFANFVKVRLLSLADRETPISTLFGVETAETLEQNIIQAPGVQERIAIIEDFFRSMLSEKSMIDNIVQSTVDTLLATKGSSSIQTILQQDPSKRRQLERKFVQQIGLSPKKLGKVIRLQSALNMLLNEDAESLTHLAYENNYYDQAHFIKDFKEFTGTNPTAFLGDENMALSALFYKS